MLATQAGLTPPRSILYDSRRNVDSRLSEGTRTVMSLEFLRIARQTIYRMLLRACPDRQPWMLLGLMGLVAGSASAQEASWIWSPEHPRAAAPAGDCFFRKAFQVGTVEEASITVTADDAYELYLNGRRLGAGNSIRQMEQYDVTRLVRRGRNVIAIRVHNASPGPAALAARVFVKQAGSPWASYSTDGTWVTSIDEVARWESLSFNDMRWAPAQVFGLLGRTAPWDHRQDTTPERLSENQRFQISPEFEVLEILDHEQTGSLINIAFNEFGHIIASQEGGPLLLIYDSDQDGIADRVREYCDLVGNIQGILPLNGDVYVTGEGQEGPGVYRLIDADRNGALEEAELIVQFRQSSSEHGAHGLVLGEDGMIYCVLGNHATVASPIAPSSPLRDVYEGDTVLPRYEDPGGHARGIKAPGGSVIRFDLQGQTVELVAGGLRNAYDLAFNSASQLFVHDSDMESDEGAPWYRPTSIFEIAEGGEYGWRSGWAKWPTHYYDRLPPVLETGRGSPTGCCVYEHVMFPQRFHGNLFFADWTSGHILAVDFDKDGHAHSQVFLRGQPLNVTDLAVGPDGWLYFCTGGRGTRGGIYQVRWKGNVPDEIRNLGEGIQRALRQPQIDSAWARQSLATLKSDLGSQWDAALLHIATDEAQPPRYRQRALKLMQLLGPLPPSEVLIDISRSSSHAIRRQCATMFAHWTQEPGVAERLGEMLLDPEPSVQIAAAEAMLRGGYEPSIEAMVPLLRSPDRSVAWAGRRLLERVPPERWRTELLEHPDQRVRLQSGLALIIAAPTPENSVAVNTMLLAMLSEFVSDRNFADLLRLVQVNLHRGTLPPEEQQRLAEAMAAEFPVGEPLLNRELVRILARLNVESTIPDMLAYIHADNPLDDRLHMAMHLRYFDHAWTAGERYALIKFFEQFNDIDAGSGVPLYVMNVTRDLCADMSLEEARIFVSEGAQWPNAALIALYRFPEKLERADLEMLKRLDKEIDRPGFEADQYKRLRTGIVALLTQHGDAEAMAYLREIWIRNPERRQAVALGLAMQPNDENWDYLVRSLPVLESFAVVEVMRALQTVPVATDDPQALREVILHGLKMQREGGSPEPAIRLLEYWTGEHFEPPADASEPMAAWQSWFASQYPTELPAVLPEPSGLSPWTMETLAEYFASSEGRRGDPENGRQVYEKAQCARCHRKGDMGVNIGPDLSYVTNRFSRNEVIQSILYPSQNISDQYKSQRVLTLDGQVYTGIVAQHAPGTILVRDAELNEHIVAEQDIQRIEPSQTSMMPTGLVDELTAAEIRDLMTFLGYLPSRQMARSGTDEPPQR
ncbi:MAG: heme-binding protein [Planctomycetota bacterium]|nr:MAG: heme-binding protein [Planctomycetota bacterium]